MKIPSWVYVIGGIVVIGAANSGPNANGDMAIKIGKLFGLCLGLFLIVKGIDAIRNKV